MKFAEAAPNSTGDCFSTNVVSSMSTHGPPGPSFSGRVGVGSGFAPPGAHRQGLYRPYQRRRSGGSAPDIHRGRFSQPHPSRRVSECRPSCPSSPRDGHRAKIERKSVGIANASPKTCLILDGQFWCNSRLIGLLHTSSPLSGFGKRLSMNVDKRRACSWPDDWMAWPCQKSFLDPHEEPRGGKSTGAGPNSQRPDPAHVCCRRPG